MRRPQVDKTDKAKEDYEFERQGNECTFAPKLSRPVGTRAVPTATTS
jgi:hypothetical protein